MRQLELSQESLNNLSSHLQAMAERSEHFRHISDLIGVFLKDKYKRLDKLDNTFACPFCSERSQRIIPDFLQ